MSVFYVCMRGCATSALAVYWFVLRDGGSALLLWRLFVSRDCYVSRFCVSVSHYGFVALRCVVVVAMCYSVGVGAWESGTGD